MIIAVPFVLPTLLPLIVAFFWLRHRYITTGREVKRFDATTRSPVYASFSAALKVCFPAPCIAGCGSIELLLSQCVCVLLLQLLLQCLPVVMHAKMLCLLLWESQAHDQV